MEYLNKLVKSKTFWLGMAQIVTAVGMLVTGEQTLNEVLFGASGVLTIIFRIITVEPIGAKK